jgi:hypothetical protein
LTACFVTTPELKKIHRQVFDFEKVFRRIFAYCRFSLERLARIEGIADRFHRRKISRLSIRAITKNAVRPSQGA